MIAPRKASVVYRDILDSRKYSLAYHIAHICRESWEVAEALFHRDITGAKLEMEQVMYAIQMMLHQYTGKDFDLAWCSNTVQEFYNRRTIWLQLFKDLDIPFCSSYLDGGSNFRRTHKIVAALAAAGYYISDYDAEYLRRRYRMQSLANKIHVPENQTTTAG
jgi:hypothetical protein